MAKLRVPVPGHLLGDSAAPQLQGPDIDDHGQIAAVGKFSAELRCVGGRRCGHIGHPGTEKGAAKPG